MRLIIFIELPFNFPILQRYVFLLFISHKFFINKYKFEKNVVFEASVMKKCGPLFKKICWNSCKKS